MARIGALTAARHAGTRKRSLLGGMPRNVRLPLTGDRSAGRSIDQTALIRCEVETVSGVDVIDVAVGHLPRIQIDEVVHRETESGCDVVDVVAGRDPVRRGRAGGVVGDGAPRSASGPGVARS